jgi:hypothetical protein
MVFDKAYTCTNLPAFACPLHPVPGPEGHGTSEHGLTVDDQDNAIDLGVLIPK